jgi:hypothetical protein
MKNKNCASGQAIIDSTEVHKPFEMEQKITGRSFCKNIIVQLQSQHVKKLRHGNKLPRRFGIFVLVGCNK